MPITSFRGTVFSNFSKVPHGVTLDGETYPTVEQIDVSVERIQRAQIGEGWRWRNPPNQRDKAPTVHDGTPSLGREEPSYYDRGEKKPMRALIPDTPQARAALLSIRTGFRALEEKLADILHPDKAEASLLAIYQGATVPSLTAGTSSPLKESPPEDTERVDLPERTVDLPKGRVRTKAWIGTRPPGEGGEGPRG